MKNETSGSEGMTPVGRALLKAKSKVVLVTKKMGDLTDQEKENAMLLGDVLGSVLNTLDELRTIAGRAPEPYKSAFKAHLDSLGVLLSASYFDGDETVEAVLASGWTPEGHTATP